MTNRQYSWDVIYYVARSESGWMHARWSCKGEFSSEGVCIEYVDQHGGLIAIIVLDVFA